MAKQFIHGSANHKPAWYKRYQEIQETRQPTANEDKAQYSNLMAELRGFVGWAIAGEMVRTFEQDYRRETGSYKAPYCYLVKRVSEAVDYQHRLDDDPLNEFLMATDDGEVDWDAEFTANRMIGMGG